MEQPMRVRKPAAGGRHGIDRAVLDYIDKAIAAAKKSE
jgi:hypothetical protein